MFSAAIEIDGAFFFTSYLFTAWNVYDAVESAPLFFYETIFG